MSDEIKMDGSGFSSTTTSTYSAHRNGTTIRLDCEGLFEPTLLITEAGHTQYYKWRPDTLLVLRYILNKWYQDKIIERAK